MVDLLKAFGRGVLYVILLPFFLVALALFGVIGLGDFIFQIVKSVVFFFTGQKFFPELPEDRELRLMRENAQAKAEAAAKQQQPVYAQTSAQGSPLYQDYQQGNVPPMSEQPRVAPMPAQQRPVEQACFNDEPKDDLSSFIREEAKPQPEPQVQPKVEQHEEELINPSFEQEREEEKLETYRPKETHFSGEYEDDDDTNNGVDINFDD